jgi:hypothetical protein
MAMNVPELLSAIDSEISRLQQVHAILSSGTIRTAVNSGRPAKKRTMSATGRARIAEAQRKRWANQKKS